MNDGRGGRPIPEQSRAAGTDHAQTADDLGRDLTVLQRTWEPRPGFIGWLMQVNHRAVGKRFIVTAFVFFVLGGILALFMRLQLALPGGRVLDPDTYNQFFTMHGTTMMFFFIVPALEGMFIYFVPLMIGARDMVFPRMNAFGYWVFLIAGVTLYAAFFLGLAPDAGWFGYANLTSRQFSPGMGIDFWVLSLQVMGVASLAAAVNFVVTILNMRAPGMSLMRMPLFVWMALIVQILILLAFPALTVVGLGDHHQPGAHLAPAAQAPMELLGASIAGDEIHAVWESTYQIYDASSGRWSAGPTPRLTRHALQTFYVDGSLYAVAGCTTALRDTPVVERIAVR